MERIGVQSFFKQAVQAIKLQYCMERIGWQNNHVLLKQVNEAINNWNISSYLDKKNFAKK